MLKIAWTQWFAAYAVLKSEGGYLLLLLSITNIEFSQIY